MMWIARSKDGSLDIFEDCPTRGDGIWRGSGITYNMEYYGIFPDLKWEDEPIQIKIIPV